MISEGNQTAPAAAGLTYVLGARMPHLPSVVTEWQHTHPGQETPDQLVLTQRWFAGSCWIGGEGAVDVAAHRLDYPKEACERRSGDIP